MGTKVNQRLYLVELLFICGLITLAYFVVGNVTVVSKDLFVFCLVVNVLCFKKEVKNVVPHYALLCLLFLNLAGIWLQYILYGVKMENNVMNFYLLADVLTAFLSLLVVFFFISIYISKGVKEMSFGKIEDYDEYIKEFKLLIAVFLMVALITTFDLSTAYNEIRKYLLYYSPKSDTIYTRYFQYIIFWVVDGLAAVGLYSLLRDLRKEEQKKIEERFKKEDSV